MRSVDWHQHIEWNEQSEFHSVTLTAYYPVVLAIVTKACKQTNTQSHTIFHYNQPTANIWQVLRLQGDSPGKKVWVAFVMPYALSTHCRWADPGFLWKCRNYCFWGWNLLLSLIYYGFMTFLQIMKVVFGISEKYNVKKTK